MGGDFNVKFYVKEEDNVIDLNIFKTDENGNIYYPFEYKKDCTGYLKFVNTIFSMAKIARSRDARFVNLASEEDVNFAANIELRKNINGTMDSNSAYIKFNPVLYYLVKNIRIEKEFDSDTNTNIRIYIDEKIMNTTLWELDVSDYSKFSIQDDMVIMIEWIMLSIDGTCAALDRVLDRDYHDPLYIRVYQELLV